MNTRPTVEADMRRALARAGHPEPQIDDILGELSRVWLAVERSAGKVEPELAWALLVLAADKQRKHAKYLRTEKRLHLPCAPA